MKILLDRGQKKYTGMSLVPLRFGSGVVFTIKARLELENDERKLIEKYNLTRAVITEGSFWKAMRTAFPQALLVTILAAIITVPLYTVFVAATRSFNSNFIFVLPAIFFLFLFIYYKDAREEILVSDFLYGWRTFRADTVVDLVQKEAYLESVCQYLQHLLVTSKHWDHRGVIDVQPLEKSMAKLAVLKAIS